MDERREVVLASWSRRLAALLVDGIVTTIPAAILIAIGVGILVGLGEETDGAEASPGILAVFWTLFALAWLVQPAYFTYFQGNERGQTPGKMLLGVRVRDDATGGRIGYGRAFCRYLITFVMWSFYLPGILDGPLATLGCEEPDAARQDRRERRHPGIATADRGVRSCIRAASAGLSSTAGARVSHRKT